ncbi:hypothetical protein [Micromonospora sp. KC606]|uniref:hypothetical protein n=1 Tax=Micromonospora sp. KC606 TaxID=2530379 RepID=UPI001FB83250|nr:hypothetical protein [Micromonospora sp. KC606]
MFLLHGCLEVDIGFTPTADFGPRGPSWRTVFGQKAEPTSTASPSHDNLTGLAWHHVLHAWVCIQRRRWWQAEHWISAARAQVLALACRRLGYPTSYALGAHLLPADVTTPLEAALVRSLTEAELRRALNVTLTVLTAELDLTDPTLATRLRPMFMELTS